MKITCSWPRSGLDGQSQAKRSQWHPPRLTGQDSGGGWLRLQGGDSPLGTSDDAGTATASCWRESRRGSNQWWRHARRY
ncbi:Hypothetical predicted protein [Cloeon dipterum]|uniref:Uncharacterized protein n=1 Tax=Cloeon dipterum TaxID=197152 RepID=A0A8S1DX96_9INSE|nr:Hypothetical predicted protein [Cloeon dipterum]